MRDNIMIRSSQQPKIVSLVAGGVLSSRFLPSIRSSSVILGVDRGALWLINHGIAPDVAVGDFDSVTPAEKQRIHDHAGKYIEYLPEKDTTDLELAAEEAITLKPSEVMIYGATGKRFDHAMGAIQVLQKLVSHNIHGVIVDNFNKIHIVRRLLTVPMDPVFRYISVLPVVAGTTVSLTGFAYELIRKPLPFGSTLGISNEITSEIATISVHRGQVLVIQSRDTPVR